jgi:hypothetical protein
MVQLETLANRAITAITQWAIANEPHAVKYIFVLDASVLAVDSPYSHIGSRCD